MPNTPTSATILVVDDDPGLLRLVEKTLQHEGFSTATASSGQAAMEWRASHHADLLLLDLKLQDLDGKELINQLAASGRSLPFIIITGQGDERVAVEMMKRGALDYLVKDSQFTEVMPAVVQRALAQIETEKRLTAVETDRKNLEKALLDLTEREQRRFGHDLHDGLGQRLTGLEMLSNVLAEDLKGHSAPLARQARRLNRELRETVTQARLLSHSLAPVPLEGEGLMRALTELAASTSRIPGVKCRFVCTQPVCVQDPATATHLYRIAQEAVNNALKHGQATKIEIALTEQGDSLQLSVDNNGSVMPASPPANPGLGLHVMRYRAGMIGASLSLESGKSKGVRVSCVVRRKT